MYIQYHSTQLVISTVGEVLKVNTWSRWMTMKFHHYKSNCHTLTGTNSIIQYPNPLVKQLAGIICMATARWFLSIYSIIILSLTGTQCVCITATHDSHLNSQHYYGNTRGIPSLLVTAWMNWSQLVDSLVMSWWTCRSHVWANTHGIGYHRVSLWYSRKLSRLVFH